MPAATIAQEASVWPERLVIIVVPCYPGGFSDAAARLLAAVYHVKKLSSAIADLVQTEAVKEQFHNVGLVSIGYGPTARDTELETCMDHWQTPAYLCKLNLSAESRVGLISNRCWQA